MKTNLTACPDCDLMVELPEQLTAADAYCPRCQKLLREGHTDAVRRARFITLCGLTFFFPAMSLPLLEIHFHGASNTSSVIASIMAYHASGHRIAAMIVFAMVIIGPLLNFVVTGMAAFLRSTHWSYLPLLLRLNHHVREWSMLEVFMLSILVSIVKLRVDVEVIYGPGLICFMGLLVMMMAMVWAVDDHVFWTAIENPAEKELPIS